MSDEQDNGEFVPVAMHDKLKRQRDMLLEAMKANEAFVTEMVTFGGKYSFLTGTDIIPDAYAQLKQMSVAIAAVESEK